MRIEIHHHDDRETLEILRRLENKMSELSDKVDTLVAEVAAENDVITGAEQLLGSLNQLLQDAISNPGNDPVTIQKVQSVIDQIDAKKSELAAAITTNTPAAPAPAPPVEPPAEPVTEPAT